MPSQLRSGRRLSPVTKFSCWNPRKNAERSRKQCGPARRCGRQRRDSSTDAQKAWTMPTPPPSAATGDNRVRSFGVAHECTWGLQPAKAYAWRFRLQDEIRPDFAIDVPKSDRYRFCSKENWQ